MRSSAAARGQRALEGRLTLGYVSRLAGHVVASWTKGEFPLDPQPALPGDDDETPQQWMGISTQMPFDRREAIDAPGFVL